MSEVAAAAAAGKAIVAAGERVLASDAGQKQQLRELANDSPTMRVAAESYAKRVAVKQAIMLKVFEPLAKWMGISREYFDTGFPADMAEKVADIPNEDVVTPKPSVAIPAMQGLAYSLEEPDLKEMYLNLLATATDRRRSEEAHPSFAEIIKQLSAEEARLLTHIIHARETAIIRVKQNLEGGGYNSLQSHVLDLRDTETGANVEAPLVPTWVDNWVRLGLVRVQYDEFFAEDARYKWVEDNPVVVRYRNAGVPEGITLDWDKGVLQTTDFGRRFGAAIDVDNSRARAAAEPPPA